MTRTIYFSGGEDFDFTSIGTATVDTTSGHYRSSFARCAVKAADGSSYWETGAVMSVTSAWFHARTWMAFNGNSGASTTAATQAPTRITDASGITRLVIMFPVNGGSNTLPTNWQFGKVTSAGVYTQLGSVFSGSFTGSPSSPDALDIQILNYGASGTVNIYINTSLVYTFTGDLTTNSNTTINGLRLAGIADSGSPARTVPFSYSEVIISDTDTRNLLLATLAPAANGNADNWTTGGVTNINEVTLDDATSNTSASAAQVQQYTISGLPSGAYGVVGLCIAARAQAGSVGGPTKMDVGVRTNSTDYWSSDITLPASLGRVQNTFMTNPDTGSPFTTAELGAVAFNVGMKSIT